MIDMKKKWLGLRIDDDLYEFIEKYAFKKRMPLSQVVRLCILEFYENHQQE